MNSQTHKFYSSQKSFIIFAILSALLLSFSAQTFAADFTVNLTTDQHDAIKDGVCDIDRATVGEQCSLRAAIEEHNSLSVVNNRVLFSLPPKSTIILTTANGGEIAVRFVTGTLEIIGTGAGDLTIDGGAGDNRIFYIDSYTAVTISGETLTGGNGGGQINGGSGGAINRTGGALTLDRVHLTNNSASGGSAGGISFGEQDQKPNRIINSTISGNTAEECGGIGNFGRSSLIVVNSTISGNTARSNGGGICNVASMLLRNVTITNNTTGESGGGISNNRGTINFGNSIVAGNNSTRSLGPEILFLGDTITSAGGNLVGDSAGDSANTTLPSIPNQSLINYQPTDKRDINPLLGALANNGGETLTHELLTGSPLIDAGLNDVAVDPAMFDPALPFDQRGAPFRRIADGNGDGTAIVDIGAFERSNIRGTRPTMFDFDGDGRADIAVFRPSNGFWHVMKSTGGFSAVQWGLGTDRLVPGDYDGDGKTDLAVYRGIADNYNWHILRSSDNTYFSRRWGIDQGYGAASPVPGDYDGDGKTDLAVQIQDDFVGATPYFKILQSSTNSRIDRTWSTGFGASFPSADYDGDGKADLTAIRITSVNSNDAVVWSILQSTNGARRDVPFGLSTDKFVPADYDGDGKADIAVYRQSEGIWYRLNSSDGSFYAERFGASEDKPVPADYDGDGRTDIAVFRPSNGTWYLQQSKEGFAARVFGFGDDTPIPNVYIR